MYNIGKFEGIYRRAKEIVRELVNLSKAMMKRSQCGHSRRLLKKCTILIDNIFINESQRERKQNFQWTILHQEKDKRRFNKYKLEVPSVLCSSVKTQLLRII